MRNEPQDGDLIAAAEHWGRSFELPETPRLSVTVSNSIRARTRPSIRSASPVRQRFVFGMVASAVVVAAAAVVLFLQPSGGAKPGYDAAAFIRQAASVTPPPGAVARQTFRVTMQTSHGRRSELINVWEGIERGRYTVIELRAGDVLPAARFEQFGQTVRRTWISGNGPAGIRWPFGKAAGRLQDGRLIATLLSHSGGSRWHIASALPVTFGKRPAVELKLTGPKNISARVWLSSPGYRLLRFQSSGYTATRVGMIFFERSATPGLVSTYLHSVQEPQPVSGSSVAY